MTQPEQPRRRTRRGSRGGRGRRRPAPMTAPETTTGAPAGLDSMRGDALSLTTYQEEQTMSQHPTTTPGRDSRAAGPLAALPLSDDPGDARSEDTRTAHGSHALWCSAGLPAGVTVAEHGPLCESTAFPVDAWGGNLEPRTVWASAVQSYRHGTYAAADVVGRPPRPFVQLIWEEDSPAAARHWGAFLTPGDARSLAAALVRVAAALVRVADTAEGLDRPAPLRGGETR